ncbi:M20 aminoacylase family protein [Phreatobacter stygius]|uniref:Amidohydrolase n=1 Tax=Phreatobacter stygius TaxID=1940610 RepID=A0A4D7B6J4_9HYPH|nr:M20 aminoacylase family protein [Phreatobacter stygius]QCI63597.1 amidohydrolase [Phreatobacter stygius]
MSILAGMAEWGDEFTRLRRDFHMHPELAFAENRTSETIARLLQGWGYRVHRGLGGTGVVGSLSQGTGRRSLGIRADFDALPIQEATGASHASRHPGKMHACGHDGHSAILLAAARFLAETRGFDGTINVIFQPAEEIGRGAAAMIDQGLFALFDCDAVFGLHNMPGMKTGVLGFKPGVFWAAIDKIDVRLRGFGGHAALPHLSRDPLVAGAAMVTALQTVISRNVDPLDSAVLTVGAFHSGEAGNVIPDTADLRLNLRSFTPAVRAVLVDRVRAIVSNHARSFGIEAEVTVTPGCPALVNDPDETAFARRTAAEHFGSDGVADLERPMSVSDDFALFLANRPGAYVVLGNGEQSYPLHHPSYDFNDDTILPAASYWVKLAQIYLA